MRLRLHSLFLGFWVFPVRFSDLCFIFIFHQYFPVAAELQHFCTLHTHLESIDKNPRNASKQRTFDNNMLNSINWKTEPLNSCSKGIYFWRPTQNLQRLILQRSLSSYFPVVAESRTLYISKITTEKNESIPKFLMLRILRVKLSLETHIIVIHEKPLKWAVFFERVLDLPVRLQNEVWVF